MRAQICFFVSIVFSFVAWGAVTGSLIWPELRRRGRNEALRPLLMFHSFRFIGLAFLVPGVVSADLPAAFAEGAAYGDIVAAAFALLTLALLPGRLGIVAAEFDAWGVAVSTPIAPKISCIFIKKSGGCTNVVVAASSMQ